MTGDVWMARFLEVTKHMTRARQREVLAAMKAAYDRGETAQDRLRGYASGYNDDHDTVRDMQDGVHHSHGPGYAYDWTWGGYAQKPPDININMTYTGSIHVQMEDLTDRINKALRAHPGRCALPAAQGHPRGVLA